MSQTKILIVEDYRPLAENLGSTCKEESMIPVVVNTGQDAIKAFHEHQDLDLILLDINLPDMTGFDIFHYVRKHSKIPIIFLTSRKKDIDEVCGLEMGAEDYIKKPVQARVVFAHVRTVLRRMHNYWERNEQSKPIKEKKKVNRSHPDFTIDELTKTIYYRHQPLKLSSEEFIILSHFIKNPGQIFSTDQIIEMIDENLIVTPHSIYMRIKRIRKKLKKIDPSFSLLENYKGAGYRLIIADPN